MTELLIAALAGLILGHLLDLAMGAVIALFWGAELWDIYTG